jgi:hypothetical protein
LRQLVSRRPGTFSESSLRRPKFFLSSSFFQVKHPVHDQEKNMKTLRKLASVLVLTLVLGLSALAGQTDTPPCATPVPGQTDTVPCQPTAPGDMGDPSNSSTATAADAAFTEIMTEVLKSMLSIF